MIKGSMENITLSQLNVDVGKINHPSSKLVNDFCSNTGLQQLIQKPTRYGVARNSTIDLIMTNCQYVASADVVNFNCSDHLPIYITIKKRKQSYTKAKFFGRSYRNYVKEDFQRIIHNHNWGRLLWHLGH